MIFPLLSIEEEELEELGSNEVIESQPEEISPGTLLQLPVKISPSVCRPRLILRL
jgi:hypothetical protein